MPQVYGFGKNKYLGHICSFEGHYRFLFIHIEINFEDYNSVKSNERIKHKSKCIKILKYVLN
jgi:hypothetical protein